MNVLIFLCPIETCSGRHVHYKLGNARGRIVTLLHLHNYGGQAAVADTGLEKLLGAEEDLRPLPKYYPPLQVSMMFLAVLRCNEERLCSVQVHFDLSHKAPADGK